MGRESVTARYTAGGVEAFRHTCVGMTSKKVKEDSMATKAEMIDAVADGAGVSKADAEKTIGAFFDYVVVTSQAGDKVSVPGFGSFSTTQRSARVGRNPQTGAPVDIPASTAMKFQASSKLKATLNGR
jgi:DNA-binding protein HU-beta